MFIKIHHPTQVAGLGRLVVGQIVALTGREAMPLIVSGAASPEPYLDDIDEDKMFQERKRRAREQGQNVDWDKEPPYAGMGFVASSQQPPTANANTEDFGNKLSAAVKRLLAKRSRHDETDPNDFGAKLTRAVQARVGPRRHKTPRQPSSYLRRQAA